MPRTLLLLHTTEFIRKLKKLLSSIYILVLSKKRFFFLIDWFKKKLRRKIIELKMLERITITFKTKKQTKHKRNKKNPSQRTTHQNLQNWIKNFWSFFIRRKKNPNLKKNKETLTTTTSGNGSYNRRKYKKLMIQQLFVTQKISLQIQCFPSLFRQIHARETRAHASWYDN